MSELEFGRRLRSLRHERAETLEDVSTATGLSVAMLSRVERGQRLPSPESVEALAGHFGLPAEELMSETIASKMVNRYGRESTSRAAERMQSPGMAWDAGEAMMACCAPEPLAAPRASVPARRAGMAFSARPVEELFGEDVARESLTDAARVAEVALETTMRAVRRALASDDPAQIEEAERILERLRRAMR